MITINVKEGCIWDSREFEIKTDYEVRKCDESCEHVKDGKLRAVVVAYNEGGYNSTGICVDCLIEALKNNNLL